MPSAAPGPAGRELRYRSGNARHCLDIPLIATARWRASRGIDLAHRLRHGRQREAVMQVDEM